MTFIDYLFLYSIAALAILFVRQWVAKRSKNLKEKFALSHAAMAQRDQE